MSMKESDLIMGKKHMEIGGRDNDRERPLREVPICRRLDLSNHGISNLIFFVGTLQVRQRVSSSKALGDTALILYKRLQKKSCLKKSVDVLYPQLKQHWRRPRLLPHL